MMDIVEIVERALEDGIRVDILDCHTLNEKSVRDTYQDITKDQFEDLVFLWNSEDQERTIESAQYFRESGEPNILILVLVTPDHLSNATIIPLILPVDKPAEEKKTESVNWKLYDNPMEIPGIPEMIVGDTSCLPILGIDVDDNCQDTTAITVTEASE